MMLVTREKNNFSYMDGNLKQLNPMEMYKKEKSDTLKAIAAYDKNITKFLGNSSTEINNHIKFYKAIQNSCLFQERDKITLQYHMTLGVLIKQQSASLTHIKEKWTQLQKSISAPKLDFLFIKQQFNKIKTLQHQSNQCYTGLSNITKSFNKNMVNTEKFLSIHYQQMIDLLNITYEDPFLNGELNTFYSFIDDNSLNQGSVYSATSLIDLMNGVCRAYPQSSQIDLTSLSPSQHLRHFIQIFKTNKKSVGARAFFSTLPNKNTNKFTLHILTSARIPKILKLWLRNGKILKHLKNISSINLTFIGDNDPKNLSLYINREHLINNDPENHPEIISKNMLINIKFELNNDNNYMVSYDFENFVNPREVLRHFSGDGFDMLMRSEEVSSLLKTSFIRDILQTPFFKHIFEKFHLTGFQFNNHHVNKIQIPFLTEILTPMKLHPNRNFKIIFQEEAVLDYKKTYEEIRWVFDCLKKFTEQTNGFTKLFVLLSDCKRNTISNASQMMRVISHAYGNLRVPIQIYSKPECEILDFNLIPQRFTLQPLSNKAVIKISQPNVIFPTHYYPIPSVIKSPGQQVLLRFNFGEGFYPILVRSSDFEKERFLAACKYYEQPRKILGINHALIKKQKNLLKLKMASWYMKLELDNALNKYSIAFFNHYLNKNRKKVISLIKHKRIGIYDRYLFDMCYDDLYQDSIYQEFLESYNKETFIEKILLQKSPTEHTKKLLPPFHKGFNFLSLLKTHKDLIFKSKNQLMNFMIQNRNIIFNTKQEFTQFIQEEHEDAQLVLTNTQNSYKKSNLYKNQENIPFNEELYNTIRSNEIGIIDIENYFNEIAIVENYLSELDDRLNNKTLTRIEYLSHIEHLRHFLFSNKESYLRHLEKKYDDLFVSQREYLDYITKKMGILFENKNDYLTYTKEKVRKLSLDSPRKLYLQLQKKVTQNLSSYSLKKIFDLYQEDYLDFCKNNPYKENINKHVKKSVRKFLYLKFKQDETLKLKAEVTCRQKIYEKNFEKLLKNHHEGLQYILEKDQEYLSEFREFCKEKVYNEVSSHESLNTHLSYDSFTEHLENLLDKDNYTLPTDMPIIKQCIKNFMKKYPEKYNKFLEKQNHNENINIFHDIHIQNIIASYLGDNSEYNQIRWKKLPNVFQSYVRQHPYEINISTTKNDLLKKILFYFIKRDIRTYLGLYFLISLNLLKFILKLAPTLMFTKFKTPHKKTFIKNKHWNYTPFLNEVIQKKPSKASKNIKKLVI